MKRACRRTCGFCHLRCADQMSSLRCTALKRKGKCSHSFVREMCRLTCGAKDCRTLRTEFLPTFLTSDSFVSLFSFSYFTGCPKCKLKVSRCHPLHKMLLRTRICFRHSSNGKCRRRLHHRWEACGKCPKLHSRQLGRCDFCKGVRMVLITVQFRHKGSKPRCVRFVNGKKLPCACKKWQRHKTVCRDHRVIVRLIQRHGPIGCKKCGLRKSAKVLRRVGKNAWNSPYHPVLCLSETT